MQLGSVTLPQDTTINSPDLLKTASVTVDYSVSGEAVVFIVPRAGGESLVLNVGLTTHLLAKQLRAMVGTQQVLTLDDRTLNVVVLSVDVRAVRQYASYQDADYFQVTVNLIRV